MITLDYRIRNRHEFRLVRGAISGMPTGENVLVSYQVMVAVTIKGQSGGVIRCQRSVVILTDVVDRLGNHPLVLLLQGAVTMGKVDAEALGHRIVIVKVAKEAGPVDILGTADLFPICLGKYGKHGCGRWRIIRGVL